MLVVTLSSAITSKIRHTTSAVRLSVFDHSNSCMVLQVATYREQKKLADKQRKLQEKAHRVKEESLRDDDNVFDVAFENQGGEAAEHTVSATDIKVCVLAT